MPIHRGMSSAEFIEYLRSWAIKGNAQEVVIELIDQLRDNDGAADELEAAQSDLSDMRDNAEALTTQLKATVEALKAMHTRAERTAQLRAMMRRPKTSCGIADDIDNAARTHGEAVECLEDNGVTEDDK